MKNKLFIFLAIIALVSLVFAGCAAPTPKPEPEVIHWKVTTLFPPGDWTQENQVVPRYTAWEAESGGRLVIEQYPAGSLVDPFGVGDAVSTGAIDASFAVEAFTSTIPPGVGDLRMGLLYTALNPEDFINLYYEHGWGEIIEEAWARINVHVCGSVVASPGYLQTTFPVHELADLKGRKMRWVTGADTDFFEKAGASVVTVPNPEIYMALKLGTMEGSIYSLPELEALGFEEVIKYLLKPPIMIAVGTFIVNMDSWNALPADLQETIERINREAIVPEWELAVAYDEQVLARTKLEIYTLPDDELRKWKELASEYWDVVSELSPEAAEMVNILRAYTGIQ